MTRPNTNTRTNVKRTGKVETFTVNDPVSPDVFTFTPPPGAKKMDESDSIKAKPNQKSQE
jgi:hypothetical protein